MKCSYHIVECCFNISSLIMDNSQQILDKNSFVMGAM